MNLYPPAGGVVEASDPADIVGALPHLIGFHPAESLVAVCLHDRPRRVGLVMRLDLPLRIDEPWAQELALRVRAERCEAVVLVCYTDESDAGAALAWTDEMACVSKELSVADVDVIAALLVRDGRWWSYPDAAPCGPASGTLAAASTSAAVAWIAAEAAVAGRAVLSTRAELEASVSGPMGSSLVAAERAFEQAAEALMAMRREKGGDVTRRRIVDLVKAAIGRYAAGTLELDDYEVAAICVGLTDPVTRDGVASMPVPSADQASWVALLSALARRAPDEAAAPVCTVLAWVAYQSGDGALVNVALDRALRAEPRYTMAQLLRASMDRQVEPSVIRSVSRDVHGALASPS